MVRPALKIAGIFAPVGEEQPEMVAEKPNDAKHCAVPV